jgi:nuclear receptor-binding protein
MDTEEGVEVVWNEVIYSQSSRKSTKASKERLKAILQGLTSVKHQNIVNFYDFWHDKVRTQDRLVFITEYITSGSLAQFLKKNKKVKSVNSVSEKVNPNDTVEPHLMTTPE